MISPNRSESDSGFVPRGPISKPTVAPRVRAFATTVNTRYAKFYPSLLKYLHLISEGTFLALFVEVLAPIAGCSTGCYVHPAAFCCYSSIRTCHVFSCPTSDWTNFRQPRPSTRLEHPRKLPSSNPSTSSGSATKSAVRTEAKREKRKLWCIFT